MLSSTFITLACAGLSIASPLGNLVKKAIVTETDTVFATVYVTEGVTAIASVTALAEPVVAPVVPAAVPAAPTAPAVVQAAAAPAVPAPVAPVAAASVPPVVAAPAAAPSAGPLISTNNNAAVVGGTAAGSAAAGCGLVQPTDYASTAVYWHNIHRCNHSAPAVTWSTDLASYAATLAATCNFHHDVSIGGGGYGQNIASYGASGNVAALNPNDEVAGAASEMWYNGELPLFLDQYYGEANPDFTNFEAWGHFTQVVWKGTTKIGCATQFCSAGSLFPTLGGWYTVCNYNPAGNMGGEYAANVLKPLGHATVRA